MSTSGSIHPAGAPLEVLFERPDLPRFDLPREIVAAYGGAIGFERPRLYANFVASVDGVGALAGPPASGGGLSARHPADRFVMALLRTCADVVLVGASTLRATTGEPYDAAAVYPDAAASFARAREALGLAPRPRFVVVTASGRLSACPALEDALVATTPAGEAMLRRAGLPASTRIVAFGEERLRLADVIAYVRSEGARLVLTEGGPSLFAELVGERLVDELFLTTSPTLFGRFRGDARKALAEGFDLAGLPLDLLGLRRHGSYLFSRWSLRRPA